MPFERVRGNAAFARCRDQACRGHAKQEIGAEARTRVWTTRTGSGPITVLRYEELPLIIAERHLTCAICGKANEVSWLSVGTDRCEWPTPVIPLGLGVVDEQLEPEPGPPSLEARVAALEGKA